MNIKMNKVMKKNGILGLSIMALLLVSSCGEANKKSDSGKEETKVETSTAPKKDLAQATFKNENTNILFGGYLQIKKALIQSDPDNVQMEAKKLWRSMEDTNNDLKTITKDLMNADELDIQRQLFSDFTAAVEEVLKEDLANGTIYKQFCPMAFNNKGGFWFSEVSEIRNPYYGDMMLTCGAVKETIQ